MPRTLILTATITPPSGVPSLVRTDPALRLRDYLAAFEFYLKVPTDVLPRIVFAENSASDVAPFRELADRVGAGKEVFVTSHAGLDHPAAYGRGYGEMKLIDRIMTEYPPVAELPDDAPIWKGTGRYVLANIARLVRSAPRQYDLYCDLKDRPQPWFDMRFFSFTPAGYRRFFLGKYHDLREDAPPRPGQPWTNPEAVLRAAIAPHLGEPGVYPRFKVEPYVDGVRGWDNRSYVSGKNLAKFYVRSAARVVAPRLWI